MANVYYEKHGNPSLITAKRVAVIGYGSQGHAHALNMRDSGINVTVATYAGSPSAVRAQEDGLPVSTIEQAVKNSDVIMILIPDETQKKVYKASIEPHLGPGQTLMFAHGFNIHFGQIVPPSFVDVSMIAPKAPGHRMRELFTEGVGVPGLLAVHQDVSGQAKQNALAYAWATGNLKAGVIETGLSWSRWAPCGDCCGIARSGRVGADPPLSLRGPSSGSTRSSRGSVKVAVRPPSIAVTRSCSAACTAPSVSTATRRLAENVPRDHRVQ